MKSFCRIGALVIVFMAAMAVAQNPEVVTPKAPYDAKDAKIAILTEENLQLKANAATAAYQEQMKQLTADYKAQESTLDAWMAKVRASNGWDGTYTYDRKKDEWVHTPKAETKKK